MAGIHASGEDYLEAILMLSEKNHGEVRSIDIARELEVTKPSVSNAMKILRNGGFIVVDNDGFITLTDDGKANAECDGAEGITSGDLRTLLNVLAGKAELE